MTIKIELEEREWEVITRLIREEVNLTFFFNGSYEREEDQKFWNGLVDKLIDSKIIELEEREWEVITRLIREDEAYRDMNCQQVFNILMEKEDE
jgi:hypothetical protein